MHTNKFWRLMEATHLQSGGDTNRQARLLISELAALGPAEVIGFEKTFNGFVAQANNRRYSAASAFSRAGGFTDCGLEYFVYALIAAGEELYYKVLGSPNPHDIEAIHAECRSGEMISYVPFYAYHRATGRPHPDFHEEDYADDPSLLGVNPPLGAAEMPSTQPKARWRRLTQCLSFVGAFSQFKRGKTLSTQVAPL